MNHYSFDLQTAGSAVLRFQLNRIYTVTFNTQEKGLNYELDDQYNWIGDINSDELINILDVIQLVNLILS